MWRLSVHWFESGLWIALAAGWLLTLFFAWVIGFFAVRVGMAGIYHPDCAHVRDLPPHRQQLGERLPAATPGFRSNAPPLSLGFAVFSLERPITAYYFALSVVLGGFFDPPPDRRVETGPGVRGDSGKRRSCGFCSVITSEKRSSGPFVLSGLFAGIAGSLYSTTVDRFANQDYFHWFLSGDVVIWTLLGGVGTLVGPALGAGVPPGLEGLSVGVVAEGFSHRGRKCSCCFSSFSPRRACWDSPAGRFGGVGGFEASSGALARECG